MEKTTFQISTGRLELALQAEGRRLRLTKYGDEPQNWLQPASQSRLFAVYVNGRRYDATNLQFLDLTSDSTTPGVTHYTARLRSRNFGIDQHIKVYKDSALIETWPILYNHGDIECRVNRMDAFSFDLKNQGLRLLSYTSRWGGEFEPLNTVLDKKVILQTRRGRSSNGMHPWFGLFSPGGPVLAGSIAWSGNWVFRFESLDLTTLRVSGGMHNWEFEKTLQPGETLESPPCILALGTDLDEIANQFSGVGRRFWQPQNTFARLPPVEWNHWWSYEDVEINEEVFARNIEAAAQMGIEVCTLDAGWFGPSDSGTHWYDHRGDWDLVNKKRFPHGIRPLAELAHARGMRFGLWCEIEGLGKLARLAEEHPEFVARRAGERLGYVCFGSPAVQEWAFQTLSGLIDEHHCDWIKLDFNLDPGAGCNRTDHGHQAGDGLYAHYRGYYVVLERIRQAYPEVVLENCSSGGLRIDPGILRQTHLTFLSDPDWPVHDLQILWGASTMTAPETCLHWSFCEWRMDTPPPQQNFNPHSPDLTQKKLDYYTRISMLGAFGFSQKLPDFPQWVTERLKLHIQIYQQHVRRFIRDGNLYRLTEQPRRSGEGERWAAFQYSLPDLRAHLLFVFRLPGAPAERTIHLRGLQKERLYTLSGFEAEAPLHKTGAELMMKGITFEDLLEEDSVLLIIA